MYRKTYADRRRVPGEEDPKTLESLNSAGVAEPSLGQTEDALQEFEAVSAARRKLWGDDDPGALDAQGNVGLALARLGRFDQAESVVRRSLAAAAAAGRRIRSGLEARLQVPLGRALLNQRRFAEAD